MVCTCISQSPGSTVIPSVEMTSAFCGTDNVSIVPTALIFSPSIIITLFLIGVEPNPSIKVPPTKALRLFCCPKDEVQISNAR